MAKRKKIEKNTPEMLWSDRKRILGMPLTFIKYSLSEDRLFFETGFFNTRSDEILLYRVRDISVTISFWQRFTKVGTVTVNSTDTSAPILAMRNIKQPREVKELIHKQVEKAKLAYRVRYTEMMGDLGAGVPGMPGGPVDLDGDGIPDALENE
ncbi:MAG: PH domain-containing protein [Clostridiales bacterium]|nr:PH domain-containing protein [Clostridiales bacterium]